MVGKILKILHFGLIHFLLICNMQENAQHFSFAFETTDLHIGVEFI